jgi:sugar phosphate isomerase/epimerase
MKRPDLLCFPKFFHPHLTMDQLADTMAECGFDGVDVMIRDTAWCNDDDYTRTLPRFAATMRERDLKCYTATTNWTYQNVSGIEDAYRLFADNGISMFRFLMQTYRGRKTYREDFAKARATAEELEKLGLRHKVKVLFQNHGGALFFSPATAYFMTKGLDPAAVGVHYDPGNLRAQEGWTNPTLSVDVLGEYLAYVGVKNAGWFLLPDSSRDQILTWQRHWTRLSAGMVDWREVLTELRAAEFQGPLCMHNFYESTLEGLRDGTAEDVRYLRGLVDEVWT